MVGACCVKGDQGNLAISNEAKAKAWKEYYESLLNVEFPWSADNLLSAEPVLDLTTGKMVVQAINKMKQCKAPGSTDIAAEMLKASLKSVAHFFVILQMQLSQRE